MSDPEDTRSTPESAKEAGGAVYQQFLDIMLTGMAIIIPVIITLYIIRIALNFIANALNPFISLLQYFGLIERFESVELISLLIDLNIYSLVIDFITELIALGILLATVFIVGSIGHNRYGERIISSLDLLIASIPGIGTVYKSFRRMGDVMLDNEAENFQDIKLVRCLGEELYVLGFETNTAPSTIETSTQHEEMMTMFIPMAPNPVTGGFLTYVPCENVYEIDMTIEDGIKSILTSGVATGEESSTPSAIDFEDIGNIAGVDQVQDALSSESRDDTETE